MVEPGLGIVLGQILAGHRQHAAGARRRVVDGAHHAGLGQNVVVLDEEQVDHQPDDFARGEVLSGSLVRKFGELADQFLEDRAHLGVADGVRDAGRCWRTSRSPGRAGPALARRSIWAWNSKRSKMSRTAGENAWM